jgi:hypothetical protein
MVPATIAWQRENGDRHTGVAKTPLVQKLNKHARKTGKSSQNNEISLAVFEFSGPNF